MSLDSNLFLLPVQARQSSFLARQLQFLHSALFTVDHLVELNLIFSLQDIPLFNVLSLNLFFQLLFSLSCSSSSDHSMCLISPVGSGYGCTGTSEFGAQ